VSHFTTIKTKLTEKKYILKALSDLGLAFQVGNLKIRGYKNKLMYVDIKISTNNPDFDLGFRKRGETYDLIADWWGIKDIDKNDFLLQIHQRYAYHVAKDFLTQKDFTILEEKNEEDRSIHIVVRRMT
jgi:hypothetical protein